MSSFSKFGGVQRPRRQRQQQQSQEQIQSEVLIKSQLLMDHTEQVFAQISDYVLALATHDAKHGNNNSKPVDLEKKQRILNAQMTMYEMAGEDKVNDKAYHPALNSCLHQVSKFEAQFHDLMQENPRAYGMMKEYTNLMKKVLTGEKLPEMPKKHVPDSAFDSQRVSGFVRDYIVSNHEVENNIHNMKQRLPSLHAEQMQKHENAGDWQQNWNHAKQATVNPSMEALHHSFQPGTLGQQKSDAEMLAISERANQQALQQQQRRHGAQCNHNHNHHTTQRKNMDMD